MNTSTLLIGSDAQQADQRVGFGDEIDADLSTLACYAAGEIDELTLGHDNDLRCVSLLAERISDLFEKVSEPTSPKSLLDPTAVSVMMRAIDKSSLAGGSVKDISVKELIEQTSKIRERLTTLVETPRNGSSRPIGEYKELSHFCLVLSKQASAHEQSLDDWNPQTR